MRDYDPTTGRYTQADPLGLVDGASVYGYALQNPGRYVDPRGEFVTDLPLDDPRTVVELPPILEPPQNMGVWRPSITLSAILGLSSGAAQGPMSVPSTTEVDETCEEDCTPANAVFWNSLQNYRGPYRRQGSGRNLRYYKWDYLHYCEVEVYDRNGRHLGAVDGMTGQQIKGPTPGRRESGLR